MGDLGMYAIGIDEVRDMFGADEQLAGELRRIASEAFRAAPPPPRPTGLLGRLGPLTRRAPDAPLVPHGTPLPSDVETLLGARFVRPERLETAWTVVRTWLSQRSLGQHHLARSAQQVDQLEFELTRAGLPSQHGIGTLMGRSLQVPLRPAPGMRTGYAKHAHVVASARALHGVLDEVLPHSAERARELAGFLDRFEQWGRDAQQQGRCLPDLVVLFDTAP